MADAIDQLATIADILAEGLKDQPFAILSNDRYVVIVSDQYGIATVVAERDAVYAHKNAMEIARQASLLGISATVHAFVVSDRPDGDGDIFVRPSHIAVDVRAAMVGRAGGKAVLKLEDAHRLVDFLNGKASRGRVEKNAGAMPPVTPEFSKLLVACVERALGENKPWVAGVQITPEYVVSEKFMLGPILLVAAENWTAPYLASKRQGGFSFSVKTTEDSIIGYEVTGLDMASPMIVLVAVAAAVRRLCDRGICKLDDYLLRFAEFLRGIGRTADIFSGGDMDTMLVDMQ